jgi:hypothetical protein
MYALSLDDNNRILSVCVALPTTPEDMPRVEALPESDVTDYLYINGEYIHDPLPAPDTSIYADRNYEAGELITADGYYEAIANIPRGGKLVEGQNVRATTLEDYIKHKLEDRS